MTFELADHVVGRLAELQRLEDALDSLADGQARAIGVFGSAGIGKTRVLTELAARADARGHIVLSGAGADLERDLGFRVFVDALDEYAGSVESRRLDNLEADVRAELAQVFPSLSGLARGAKPGMQDERYRVNRAVRELLERLAATKPLVLVLDDVHWADPASVDLLLSLLHRPPAAAVLTVVAARPNQGAPRLVAGLQRAFRDGEIDWMDLEPLSREEAAQMLSATAGDRRVEALFEDSGGNPFYLEQLSRTSQLAPGESPEGHGGVAGVDVPPRVAAAMSEELAQLSDEIRLVAQGAAVAGDPFEPELAAAAAGVTEEEAVEAIDELVACDLVRTTSVPRRFRFRHPIVRRAVYEASPSGWRISAHERAARALSDRGADPRTLAHHVDASAKVGDHAAVSVLLEAGRASIHRAPATAARWFAAALRVLPDSAPPSERTEVLLANATALAAVGRFGDAYDALLEAVALDEGNGSAQHVQIVAWCARVERLLGRHERAHERLSAALDELGDDTGEEAVFLMLELAADGIFRLGSTQQDRIDLMARAVETARPLGDDVLTAAALATQARALAWGSEPQQAEKAWVEAAPLVDGLADEQLARRLNALVDLASAEIYLDRFVEAGAHAERALAVGRATGQGQLFPAIYATLGVAWCMSGRLGEAAELLDTAIEAARLAGNPPALAWALFCRGFVAIPAGDMKTALATGRESLDIAEQSGQEVIAARSASVLAVALLDAGESKKAAEALERAAGENFASIPHIWRTYLLELMTRCWLSLGARTEAERSAAEAQASARAAGLRSAEAMSLRATAAVALDAGDAVTAAREAQDATALAEQVGVPIEAALARLLAGRAAARTGDQQRAVDLLTTALAAFETYGAKRYRDAAQQELRHLGQHIHRRTRRGDLSERGVAALTERELEIGRLIVDRKTNGEIAGELFLSKKTVETHIRNLFRKLDVSSRVDVARRIEEADRSPASGGRS